jgi:hypothetical protein
MILLDPDGYSEKNIGLPKYTTRKSRQKRQLRRSNLEGTETG